MVSLGNCDTMDMSAFRLNSKNIGYMSHLHLMLFIYMHLTLHISLKIANILLRPLDES